MKEFNELKRFAKYLIDYGIELAQSDDFEKNFVIYHYDYHITDYPLLDKWDNERDDFQRHLYDEIMKDNRIIECELGTIEHCTIELVYKKGVITNEKYLFFDAR